MHRAKGKQNIADRITQQWVILTGRKIHSPEHDWLIGPFGGTSGIGTQFIQQLAQHENLVIETSNASRGLISSIRQLQLPEAALNALSPQVIDFYENTSDYIFQLDVKWNPLFKLFGALVKRIFSNRIQQLNLPIAQIKSDNALSSEIIHLNDSITRETKRTIWLRTFKDSGQVVYSGVYSTCVIPSGQACIKAVFPLPNGNATVILSPRVGEQGELILRSSGRRFGDAGFYFLLSDAEENKWSNYVRPFRDTLIARPAKDSSLDVEQILTLWGMRVVTFHYAIQKAVK